MSITPEREGPRIQVLAAELRDYVNSLEPGAKVGTVAELAERYDAKRTTLRMAIDLLIGEGLLSGGRGQSLRVRRQSARLVWDLGAEKHGTRQDGDDAAGDWWDRMIQRQDHRPSQDVRLEFLEPPPPDIALLLQWDGKTVARWHARRADGAEAMLAVSYFAYPAVAGVPLAELGRAQATGTLLAACGHPQSRLDRVIRSRMPRADEAAHFGLARGVPVFEVTCVGYEEDPEHAPGIPVYVTVGVAPADRWELRDQADIA